MIPFVQSLAPVMFTLCYQCLAPSLCTTTAQVIERSHNNHSCLLALLGLHSNQILPATFKGYLQYFEQIGCFRVSYTTICYVMSVFQVRIARPVLLLSQIVMWQLMCFIMAQSEGGRGLSNLQNTKQGSPKKQMKSTIRLALKYF